MAEILAQLFNGIVLGLLFGVMALGFMMILSVMEVINFGHGALFALGAYFALTLQKFVGYWPALILAPVFVGLLGLVIERFAIRRIYGKDPLFGLLLTLGLAMIFEEIIRIIWGKAGYSLSAPAFAAGPINLGNLWYSKYLLFLAFLSLILLFLVWIFLEKTPYGAIIKAGVSDSEMVLALGKNLDRLRTLVFGLGAALAGIAGVIAGPMWSLKPTMGTEILMPSFVVVVIGGIGSFWGAIIGGLIVGLSKSLSILVYPRMSELAMYFIMAIVLVLRPRGIMGEKSLLEE
ncbi:MAG: branched-chain amino acid ABC transporter permease [Deltaproteobacteria bacterium]|nr:MAG: branched-chain amino acid ABC transporter permease [Deltaproteobacteria bacterium]